MMMMMMSRASSILATLKQQAWEKGIAMNKEKNIPEFAVGDAVEVKVRMNDDGYLYVI